MTPREVRLMLKERISKLSPDLLQSADDARRASGVMPCSECGHELWLHPSAMEPENLGWGDQPFLRRLCTGELVKL